MSKKPLACASGPNRHALNRLYRLFKASHALDVEANDLNAGVNDLASEAAVDRFDDLLNQDRENIDHLNARQLCNRIAELTGVPDPASRPKEVHVQESILSPHGDPKLRHLQVDPRPLESSTPLLGNPRD